MDLQNTVEPKYEGFSFGTDSKRLSAALHSLADDIAAGRSILNQVRLIQTQKQDDFYVQSLIIRFFEKADMTSQRPEIQG